jgi:hypothetical protein
MHAKRPKIGGDEPLLFIQKEDQRSHGVLVVNKIIVERLDLRAFSKAIGSHQISQCEPRCDPKAFFSQTNLGRTFKM